MGYWINWVTFFRNLMASIVFGLAVPYFLISYIDPNGYIFDLEAVLFNGIIFVGVYTVYGIFKKDLVIRFLIGIGWMATLIYFYTVGNNFFTFYLPNCSFGYLCIDGSYKGIDFKFGYNYAWVIIAMLALKGLNLFRHLVKPPEKRYKYLTISDRFNK